MLKHSVKLRRYLLCDCVAACHGMACVLHALNLAKVIQVDTKKRGLLKNPTKIQEIQEKKLLTEIEPLQLAF